MPAVRVEITVPQDVHDRIEAVRGDVPRAAWIKRAIDRELINQEARATATERITAEGSAR